MTIADNLQTLIDCKADMKSAIEEKGVTVSGGLSTYADAIRHIEVEGGDSPEYIICEEGLSYNTGEVGYFDLANIVDGSNLFCNKSAKIGTVVLTPTFKNINLINSDNIQNTSYMFYGDKYLENINNLLTNNVTDMHGMFLSCGSLIELPEMDTSNVTDMMGMCETCTSLTSIKSLDTHNVKDMRMTFLGCDSLISLPFMDFTNVVNVQWFLKYSTAITTLGGFKNLGAASGFIGSDNGFLEDCQNLTYTSLMNVINNLATPRGENELKLHADAIAKLSSRDIAIATNKGWVITA